jgi:two-component system sensor histidine kinase/response regulator
MTPDESIEQATILVVDDNQQNRLVAEGHLRAAGYDVITAPSGLRALEVFAESPIDLILLDVKMPGIDGYETCRRLRAEPKGTETPIVFLTAFADLDSHRLAIGAGADDFLSKPIQRVELLLRVRSLLRIKRMHSELVRSNTLIGAQRDALVQARDARKALSAMIVHDLKSPLTTMLADGEYLLMTSNDSESREILEEVVGSVNLMHRMVLDLLDVDRSDDGALVPHFENVDIVKLIEGCVTPMRRRVTSKHCDITVAIDEDVRSLSVDPELVRRVFDNLLDNAAKYAPTDDTIRIVGRRTANGGVSIRMEDRGPGVPTHLRDTIFEPYKRIERDERVHARSSRGLGLAFCRLAVEAHGGRLWVEANDPVGSAFCLSLPPQRTLEMKAHRKTG